MNSMILRWKFFKEAFHFWLLNCRYNASIHTEDDIEKYRYVLLRMTHTIEKGLSLRSPRKGFGQEKVKDLLGRLKDYQVRYGSVDPDFICYPLSTISHYIEFTEAGGTSVPEIRKSFDELVESAGVVISPNPGVRIISRKEVASKCGTDFASLMESRHSVRYFTDEPVTEDMILRALEIAQRTPSACNRQGWKTYIFQGDKCRDLLSWQGGCRGFESEILSSILVTCNMKAFLYYEVHQAYVDGGLYAMNLINAFHSLGVGTIPLSVAFDHKKLRKLDSFGIPENEVPIVIVGIGNMPDEFKAAASERKDISTTNTFV